MEGINVQDLVGEKIVKVVEKISKTTEKEHLPGNLTLVLGSGKRILIFPKEGAYYAALGMKYLRPLKKPAH